MTVKVYVLQADSENYQVNQNLRTYLQWFFNDRKPAGVNVVVESGEVVIINVRAEVKILLGADTNRVRQVIESLLQDFFSFHSSVFGKRKNVIKRSEIIELMESVDGVVQVDELISPANNVMLEPQQFPRLGTILINFTEINP